jgi:hypothetical protein
MTKKLFVTCAELVEKFLGCSGVWHMSIELVMLQQVFLGTP